MTDETEVRPRHAVDRAHIHFGKQPLCQTDEEDPLYLVDGNLGTVTCIKCRLLLAATRFGGWMSVPVQREAIAVFAQWQETDRQHGREAAQSRAAR